MAYINYSMSENAGRAYSDGEKPFSKWTKTEILGNIGAIYGPGAASFCKKFSTAFLKESFLDLSSWHHTSKFFNKTCFYSFNENLELEEILNLKEEKREKAAAPDFFPCIGYWTDWEGTRRHPRPVAREEYGRSDGKVFYSFNGEKKLVSGKNFRLRSLKIEDPFFLNMLEEMKKAFKKAFKLKTTHKFNKWIHTGRI